MLYNITFLLSIFSGITAGARSAFYPDLTLSGNGSWNTGRDDLTWSALGNLVAPILNRNTNKANLKAAKARQEEAKLGIISDIQSRTSALIALYQALGGGVE